MIAALSNHFSRLLSPRFYLSSVVKTARYLSVRADCNVHSRMLVPIFTVTAVTGRALNISSSVVSSPIARIKSYRVASKSLFTSEPLVNSGDFISITLLPCMICKFCFKQIDIKELTNCCARNLPNHASASR